MPDLTTPERIACNGGWWIEYPKGFSRGDPREGEYWLYSPDGIGKMIVGFDEDGALEIAKLMRPAAAIGTAVHAIEKIRKHAEAGQAASVSVSPMYFGWILQEIAAIATAPIGGTRLPDLEVSGGKTREVV